MKSFVVLFFLAAGCASVAPQQDKVSISK